jgi:hypothetical protein
MRRGRIHIVSDYGIEGWVPSARWVGVLGEVVWYLGLIAAAYTVGYLAGMGAGVARAIAVLME